MDASKRVLGVTRQNNLALNIGTRSSCTRYCAVSGDYDEMPGVLSKVYKIAVNAMPKLKHWRRAVFAIFIGCAIAAISFSAQVGLGTLTPAAAQNSLEFRYALSPFGVWRHHPRFGEVWLPRGVPRDWRPYEFGHWVYTDEWGWYWVSDEGEADWGWVAFHYGRWVYERGWGWFWVPGDEWAPAWVDWRYGDDYVGWAPMPPDDLLNVYEDEPMYWVFVQPRYIIAPQPRRYFIPSQRRAGLLRATHIVNRTFAPQGARVAVNPGIPAGFIAAQTRKPLPTYRVAPRVIAGTQGVAGAVTAQPGQRVPGPISLQRTKAAIQPQASPVAPQSLSKGQRGQFGGHTPRAAQGANVPAGAPPLPAVAPKSAASPPAAAPAPKQPTTNTPVAPPSRLKSARPRPSPPPPAGAPPPKPATPPPVAHPSPPKVMHPATPAATHPTAPAATHPAPPPVRKPAPVAHPPVRHAPAVTHPAPRPKKPAAEDKKDEKK
jgi:hypothetical protein